MLDMKEKLKMKKRIIATAFLALTLIALLAGRGKKVDCDFCGETKKGETKTVFGEEISICNDCLKELNDF